MKLLMISGDKSLAAGKRGAFYYMLEEFSKYWERIDIIVPKSKIQIIPNQDQNSNAKCQKFFGNVYVHPSSKSILFQPWFIKKKGVELYNEHKHNLVTVHEYPPFYNGIGARWLYNKIKAPYVIEFHHIVGYPMAADFRECFYRFLYKIFVKYVCAKAKVVRVVNEKQTRDFLMNLGVNADKIKNIGSQYIDLDVFRPLPLDKLGVSASLREKKYDIVFAGRLVKNKNVKMLIKAVKILKDKGKDLKCVIIGDGPEFRILNSEVRNKGLEGSIEFLGWLPTIEDVAEIYNQSRIFVMPSLNEGGPRVCLEAMACGVPVVTTRVGVMIDVIKDGENPSTIRPRAHGREAGSGPSGGMFCDWTAEDMAEKILEIEKLEIKKLRDESRRTAKQFERKKMIKNLAEEYKRIINN